MVGVPAFTKCVCGPSLRIGWPPLSFARRAITLGPHQSENANAVSAPKMARMVK